ncbi:MAG: polyprenyl synthetase family protein [Clostridia bacterium]|nr:polyprenyl synthetase family protein [Clostridia bacterium]
MTENSTIHADRAPLSYDAALRSARETVDAALRGAPPLLRPYTSHLAGAEGKLLRAAALLTCAQGEEGGIPVDAVPFAAAVELLHLATLVHDDVIDDADQRRGIPTIQRKWGKRTAVICGDYLLSAALRMAASAKDRERYLKLNLPDYMARVCGGELLQEQNSGNLDLTVGRYLRIIRGKTAALFECAYYGGAVLATEDRAERAAYARLGRYSGMIFQLTDDCIDYESDAETAKKPVGSDYAQGVVTLPLIYALETEPDFKSRARSHRLDRDEVVSRVRGCGALAYTRTFARGYYTKACALLDELNPAEEKRRRLAAILDRAYYGLSVPTNR